VQETFVTQAALCYNPSSRELGIPRPRFELVFNLKLLGQIAACQTGSSPGDFVIKK
jgi:hypothetical protein